MCSVEHVAAGLSKDEVLLRSLNWQAVLLLRWAGQAESLSWVVERLQRELRVIADAMSREMWRPWFRL